MTLFVFQNTKFCLKNFKNNKKTFFFFLKGDILSNFPLNLPLCNYYQQQQELWYITNSFPAKLHVLFTKKPEPTYLDFIEKI